MRKRLEVARRLLPRPRDEAVSVAGRGFGPAGRPAGSAGAVRYARSTVPVMTKRGQRGGGGRPGARARSPKGASGKVSRKGSGGRGASAAGSSEGGADGARVVPEPVVETVRLPLSFHPWRGGHVGEFDRGLRSYRGGESRDWRRVATVRMLARRTSRGLDVLGPAPGESLPKGFLWGDPGRQQFGMGGPDWVFGPLERPCRRCATVFVSSAEEQKRMHEERGCHIDVMPALCRDCRQVKRVRKEYSERVGHLGGTPAPDALLHVARLGARLLAAGEQVNVDRLIGYSRTARRTKRLARDAALVEEELLALRASGVRRRSPG